MFNAGRILRNLNRRESVGKRSSFLVTRARKEKKKKKFRCYVPFIWQALVATSVGFLVICVGAGLCVVGYYAEWFRTTTISTSRRLDNITSAWTDDGERANSFNHLRALIYVGPALMSCGSFAIVFSCVVVCEIRDKILDIMDEKERAGLPAKSASHFKLDFFQSVVYPQHNKRSRFQMTQSSSPDSSTRQGHVMTLGRKKDGGDGARLEPAIRMKLMKSDDVASSSAVQEPRSQCLPADSSCSVMDRPTAHQASWPALASAISIDGADAGVGGVRLVSATSMDGADVGASGVRAKRLRYPSDPLSVKRVPPGAGLDQPSSAVVVLPRRCGVQQGRGVEEAGRRAVTRTTAEQQHHHHYQQLQQQEKQQQQQQQQQPRRQTTSIRRLLVTRKPVFSYEGPRYNTSSVEVLHSISDVRVEPHISPMEGNANETNTPSAVAPSAVVPSAAPSAAAPSAAVTATGAIAESPESTNPGREAVQVRIEPRSSGPPRNVLVHQAYVHAEPENGYPVTRLLPDSVSFPGTLSSFPVKTTTMTSLPLPTETSPDAASHPGRTPLPGQRSRAPAAAAARGHQVPVPPLDGASYLSSMQTPARRRGNSPLAPVADQHQHQHQRQRQQPCT